MATASPNRSFSGSRLNPASRQCSSHKRTSLSRPTSSVASPNTPLSRNSLIFRARLCRSCR
eukprot:12675408-Heterocapsa_arctica.AAC.1